MLASFRGTIAYTGPFIYIILSFRGVIFVFHYVYMTPSIVPMNQYAQLTPEAAGNQANVQRILQKIRREHNDIYQELERYGMNQVIIDYVFRLVIGLTINASANQTANHRQFQQQFPCSILPPISISRKMSLTASCCRSFNSLWMKSAEAANLDLGLAKAGLVGKT